jgi:hypothetical protein
VSVEPGSNSGRVRVRVRVRAECIGIGLAKVKVKVRVKVRVGVGVRVTVTVRVRGGITSYNFTLHFLYHAQCRGFAIRGTVRGYLPPQNGTPQQ